MDQTRLFPNFSLITLCGASVLLILTLHATALGQTSQQRGFEPGASYPLSDIEMINTMNGNLSIHLPLGKLPVGRGGFSGQVNLHYDSKLYDSQLAYYEDWTISSLDNRTSRFAICW